MFRQLTPTIRSILVNEPSVGYQVRMHASNHEDETCLRTWYKRFRSEDMTRDGAKIDRTKSKVTIKYPLKDLPKAMPRIIQDKIHMSMYAKDSKSSNGYLEVVSDIDGSIGEKEVDAWNTISTVIHVAAQSEMQGNWQTMHRIHPTLKKKEFDTIAKREKEFRIQKSKNVDDSTKSAKLAEAARNAHAKTRDKAFLKYPKGQFFTSRAKFSRD